MRIHTCKHAQTYANMHAIARIHMNMCLRANKYVGDRSAIKRAYKKFALKYHPDKNPDACLEEAALLTDL